MRQGFRWIAAAALALSACGNQGSGGGGAVGTWVIDTDSLVSAILEAAKTQPGADTAMMSGDTRAAAESMMKAMAKEQASKMSLTLEFKADKTATMSMDMMGTKESGTGTWEDKDGGVTITPVTKDGKAVEGENAKPHKLTWKDGNLLMKEAGAPFEIALRRK